ncbi:hypothetical protein I302_105252 [Kwoniella bestiolae CBS 10118]|uniref:Uncharacterized protein n=1 Tax=Kwoniella bestiolae CBS 10118 TaxID=1296100 RepID=A0A1B9FSL7_9TREE|nr:hypothetical protein I302_08540 [Kwoniella bestiolae CBS 10118]OCF21761.1 hypothetical protein I302_08540 [Kwoniella bestiolae CBS 10118]
MTPHKHLQLIRNPPLPTEGIVGLPFILQTADPPPLDDQIALRSLTGLRYVKPPSRWRLPITLVTLSESRYHFTGFHSEVDLALALLKQYEDTSRPVQCWTPTGEVCIYHIPDSEALQSDTPMERLTPLFMAAAWHIVSQLEKEKIMDEFRELGDRVGHEKPALCEVYGLTNFKVTDDYGSWSGSGSGSGSDGSGSP